MHGRQFALANPDDGVFGAQAVMDQVGDGADADAVFFGEHFQVRSSGHAAVIIHDFNDD